MQQVRVLMRSPFTHIFFKCESRSTLNTLWFLQRFAKLRMVANTCSEVLMASHCPRNVHYVGALVVPRAPGRIRMVPYATIWSQMIPSDLR